MRARRWCLSVLILASLACGQDDYGDRVPPGQRVLEDEFPVFSFRGNRNLTTDDWELRIWGAVERDTTLGWEEFGLLPCTTRVEDFHCVTGWSRLGDSWTGVEGSVLMELARPDSAAVSVMVHCADGYTTNVLLEDFLEPGVMLVTEFNGRPLTAEHGYPVRLIVPHLYAWKAAKWVTGLELRESDDPGYWESHGYHMRGDPWREQRYN
ncbi:MAG: molybdopterin-dependent oxidoreductase [Candidatus Fermentibacteraceae bacterium]